MKTFEEYINESRQNYIFGGTDNRNTDMPSAEKTFAELKPGDKYYYWDNHYGKIAYEFIFSQSKVEGENKDLIRLYYTNSNGVIIDKKNFNYSIEIEQYKSGFQSCTATTFKELKQRVKEDFGVDVVSIRRY